MNVNTNTKRPIIRAETHLISHSLVSHLGELPTRPDRLQAALLVAKSIDESFCLDPDSTMINVHQDPPSSQSELFDHTNPDSWEIESLRYPGIENLLAVGLRCFLDAFYYHCGYLPRWDPSIKATEQIIPNPRFKKRELCVYQIHEQLAFGARNRVLGWRSFVLHRESILYP